MKEEIQQIDERLEALRQEWRYASPTKRKFIEGFARLLKDKQKRLQVAT